MRCSVLILLLFPLVAAASDRKLSGSEGFQEKAREVFESCAMEDYSSQKIIPVSDLNSKSYQHFWLYSLIGRHYIGEDPAPPGEPVDGADFSPLALVSELLNDYNYIWEDLNDYEKVSYSRCLTSSFLRYSLDNNNDWYIEDTDQFMLKGYGCCRHFSRLGKWILDRIGVKNQIVCSRNHAFIRVFAGDLWYSIEPQSHNRTFYYHE